MAIKIKAPRVRVNGEYRHEVSVPTYRRILALVRACEDNHMEGLWGALSALRAQCEKEGLT